MILAGDVGGTKTALALFEPVGGELVLAREATLASGDFASLEAAVDRFLHQGSRAVVDAACVGVAGPVIDGRCLATNLPWQVDERLLGYAIPAMHVRLLNDLEAAAHGVLALPDHELIALQGGHAQRGNMALIAAGTGLGEAIIASETGRRRRSIIASEGGHTDFAPRNEAEDDLLRFLRKEFGHVSYERLVSGPGLVNIYRFLRDTRVAPEARATAAAMAAGDPAAVVAERAMAGVDPLCTRALDMFVSIYGAEAGNLALKAMAVGGVVLAGGIAPKIQARLAGGDLNAAISDKGRMASLLADIPVHVAMNPRAALIGAARVARSLLPD